MGTVRKPIVKKFLLLFLAWLGAATLFAGQESEPGQSTNPESSSALATRAWEALRQKDYAGARQAARRCQELYRAQAETMQKALATLPGKETSPQQWALNDVGTCTYILGQAAEAENQREEAMTAYREVIEHYLFAQCWDPQGWYWQVAVAAHERLTALAMDAP